MLMNAKCTFVLDKKKKKNYKYWAILCLCCVSSRGSFMNVYVCCSVLSVKTVCVLRSSDLCSSDVRLNSFQEQRRTLHPQGSNTAGIIAQDVYCTWCVWEPVQRSACPSCREDGSFSENDQSLLFNEILHFTAQWITHWLHTCSICNRLTISIWVKVLILY